MCVSWERECVFWMELKDEPALELMFTVLYSDCPRLVEKQALTSSNVPRLLSAEDFSHSLLHFNAKELPLSSLLSFFSWRKVSVGAINLHIPWHEPWGTLRNGTSTCFHSTARHRSVLLVKDVNNVDVLRPTSTHYSSHKRSSNQTNQMCSSRIKYSGQSLFCNSKMYLRCYSRLCGQWWSLAMYLGYW